jgi:hypothetical protein
VSKPDPDQFEPFSLDSINALAALPFVSEQARRLEDLEVPGCRLPGVVEDGGDFPGGHGAAVEVNGEKDAPPGDMGQRGKYRFIYVHSRLGIPVRHAGIFSHKAEYLSSDISQSG